MNGIESGATSPSNSKEVGRSTVDKYNTKVDRGLASLQFDALPHSDVGQCSSSALSAMFYQSLPREEVLAKESPVL